MFIIPAACDDVRTFGVEAKGDFAGEAISHIAEPLEVVNGLSSDDNPFDTEVEEEARLRLEQNGSLRDLKGVPATLRQAYGIALALATAARQHLPLAVR